MNRPKPVQIQFTDVKGYLLADMELDADSAGLCVELGPSAQLLVDTTLSDWERAGCSSGPKDSVISIRFRAG